jgi:hypothetical protein
LKETLAQEEGLAAEMQRLRGRVVGEKVKELRPGEKKRQRQTRVVSRANVRGAHTERAGAE